MEIISYVIRRAPQSSFVGAVSIMPVMRSFYPICQHTSPMYINKTRVRTYGSRCVNQPSFSVCLLLQPPLHNRVEHLEDGSLKAALILEVFADPSDT